VQGREPTGGLLAAPGPAYGGSVLSHGSSGTASDNPRILREVINSAASACKSALRCLPFMSTCCTTYARQRVTRWCLYQDGYMHAAVMQAGTGSSSKANRRAPRPLVTKAELDQCSSYLVGRMTQQKINAALDELAGASCDLEEFLHGRNLTGSSSRLACWEGTKHITNSIACILPGGSHIPDSCIHRCKLLFSAHYLKQDGYGHCTGELASVVQVLQNRTQSRWLRSRARPQLFEAVPTESVCLIWPHWPRELLECSLTSGFLRAISSTAQ
jgi:Spindle and kinetochore-associated protein 1